MDEFFSTKRDGTKCGNIPVTDVLPKDQLGNVDVTEVAKGLLQTLDDAKGSDNASFEVLNSTTSMIVPLKIRRAVAEIGMAQIIQVDVVPRFRAQPLTPKRHHIAIM